MFWCHNCQQPIQSVQQIRCELCSCEAIEQIESNNNPQNFQPYVPPQNNQQNSRNIQNLQQNSQMSFGSMRDPLGMHLFERMGGMEGLSMMSTILQRLGDEETPVYIRYTVSRPIFGILLIDNEDNGKNPVSEEKFNKLPKVQIQQQCAICQEKQGNGLILPCKHEFHENCIKPWFQQKNTCPCCRTQV